MRVIATSPRATCSKSWRSVSAAAASWPAWIHFIGQQGKVQNPTIIFQLLGVHVGRFLTAYEPDSIMGENVSKIIQKLQQEKRGCGELITEE
jgi:hypothetical protein